MIILDEPSVGLDPNQIKEIRELIRELGKTTSIILSTHILSEVETICDRVQILNKGALFIVPHFQILSEKGLTSNRFLSNSR